MDLNPYNELISIASIGINPDGKHSSYQIYGLGPRSLVFLDEYAAKHKSILESTYEKNESINRYSSFKSYCDYLLEIVRTKKETKTNFYRTDYDEMINYFNNQSIEDISVWREISGIELKDKSIINLCEFTILDWQKEKTRIECELPYNPEAIWLNRDYSYLIGIKVKARDFTKAYELSDKYFTSFENIIHIIIGYPDNAYCVTILSSDIGLVGQCIAYSKNLGIGSKSQGWKRFLRPVTLDDVYFSDDEFLPLYQLILNENRTELQQRLYMAANWLGQAIRSNEIVDGYLKSIISLEILLSTNIDGVITPSITYQFSESIALLLGKTVEQRLAIEKEVKDMYGKRSGIVHSGNTKIERIDFLKSCQYSRNVLFELLTEPKYNVGSIKDVLEILKREKYS
jgi:hypothetical protein